MNICVWNERILQCKEHTKCGTISFGLSASFREAGKYHKKQEWRQYEIITEIVPTRLHSTSTSYSTYAGIVIVCLMMMVYTVQFTHLYEKIGGPSESEVGLGQNTARRTLCCRWKHAKSSLIIKVSVLFLPPAPSSSTHFRGPSATPWTLSLIMAVLTGPMRQFNQLLRGPIPFQSAPNSVDDAMV